MAASAVEVRACFEIMRELRPDLNDRDAFEQVVARRSVQGYRLLALWRRDQPVACAGFRILETFTHGRHLYVDDLITTAKERSCRHGERLFQAIIHEARVQGCEKVVLESGLANGRAHRFYFRQGMLPSALRFVLPIQKSAGGAE
jgi:GNAT superfamily N-acetyltransferase